MQSLGELTNFAIDRHLGRYRNYGGTIMKNEIVGKSYNRVWVINLESTTQGDGTHWTLCYPYSNALVYVDPFGEPPAQCVCDWMKKSKRTCFYSDVDMQSLSSSSCGWWCIYMVEQLEKGRRPDVVLDGFTPDHFRQNEAFLRQYFER